MSIRVQSFGTLPDGQEAWLYILTNASGASVEITNYGGILRAVNVPDRQGNLKNVVLGYPDVGGYIPVNGYLGALIGRVGNRIADGCFELNGKEYTLYKNERGVNHLHGGPHRLRPEGMQATSMEGIQEDSLILKYVSKDGEEGYPGNLHVMVTYTFTDENELAIHYEAVSDQDTLCSLTNHSYFNLSGEGDVLKHTIEIDADTISVVDGNLIPTGEVRPVGGTPFDLRKPVVLGDALKHTQENEQMALGGGFDQNFNLNGEDAGLRFAAEVRDPDSGRVMTVFTDMPAVQFYTGNSLNSPLYKKHAGLCLETQYAPDSIHHPNFPDSVLRAGEKYDFVTVFAFDVE